MRRRHQASYSHCEIPHCSEHGLPPSKLTQSTSNPPLPPVLPITGWKTFPSVTIPDGFCYGSIYNHVIETAKMTNADTGASHGLQDFSTSKPMKKGREFFVSGHVTEMKDRKKSDCYFVKALVRASFASQQYSVTVTLADTNGGVVDA